MNKEKLFGTISFITGGLTIATGQQNESLKCNNRKDNYIDEKKYPKDYFRGGWGSGIGVLALSAIMMIFHNNDIFRNPIEKFLPFWCFIVNAWLVTNAGFYDMQVERCNDDMDTVKFYANKFFIAWGSIVMILTFLFGFIIIFCKNT